MFLMFSIAIIPALIGAGLWIYNKQVIWIEWLGGCALAFLTSLIIYLLTIHAMTSDTETWSGHVISAVHVPYWEAEWTETETYTTGTGKNQTTHTRLVTKHKTHYPTWTIDTTIGSFDISNEKYNELLKRFGEQQSRPGHRPDFDEGDRNDYYLVNKNGWIEPVTDTRSWENKVKASPSVFSFPEVPPDIMVFDYPENSNRFSSDRLLGRALAIHLLDFDRLNAELGALKKVNIIIIGFPIDSDSSIAHYQEAAWIGGKKNDIVLCFGGPDNNKWSYVFGWTEEELVKRNLETILLSNPINDSILPLIKNEIKANYVIKDWDKFEYLSVEPPMISYIILIIVMAITQTIFWLFAHNNEAEKEIKRNNSTPYSNLSPKTRITPNMFKFAPTLKNRKSVRR